MTLTFRTKLLASNIALVAGVVLVVLLQISQSVGADMRRELDHRLEEQARGAAQWVGEGRHPGRLATRLAVVVHADVSIFDREGALVGSSDQGAPPSSSTAPAAGHAGDEPELVAARTGIAGHASRQRAPGGEEMHYVAVPAQDGLIVRLAVPLSDINATLRDLHERLAGAFAVAVLAAVAFGFFAARVAARPLRAMTDSATRLAAGQYDIQVASTSPDEFGMLSRSLGTLATQLKAKISDLTTERDRLSAILSGMVEGVLVLDGSGNVLLANPAAATILGAEGALEGRDVASTVHDAKLRAVLEKTLASREIHEGEIETPGDGGQTIAVYVRPLAVDVGGVVTVLRDMTRIRRLLAQRRDFVADVSHEFRTPVTAIQGYAETLLRGATDTTTARQFLEIIHRHALRLGGLVESLLELSELEVRPPEEAIRETVDVQLIAKNVAETLTKRALAEGVTLELDVADDAIAVGDPSGLEEVIENLVDNAMKYGKARGTVRVTGGRHGARVVLAIADDGAGIDPKHLPHLFERFYRVDPSRSRERGGAGLGLAIVKQIVEGMAGSVEVASIVGTGTTFTVSLPTRAA